MFTNLHNNDRIIIDTVNDLINKPVDPTFKVFQAKCKIREILRGRMHNSTRTMLINSLKGNPDKFRETLTECYETYMDMLFKIAPEPDMNDPKIIENYEKMTNLPTNLVIEIIESYKES
jgi:hypothetical protein